MPHVSQCIRGTDDQGYARESQGDDHSTPLVAPGSLAFYLFTLLLASQWVVVACATDLRLIMFSDH